MTSHAASASISRISDQDYYETRINIFIFAQTYFGYLQIKLRFYLGLREFFTLVDGLEQEEFSQLVEKPSSYSSSALKMFS